MAVHLMELYVYLNCKISVGVVRPHNRPIVNISRKQLKKKKNHDIFFLTLLNITNSHPVHNINYTYFK